MCVVNTGAFVGENIMNEQSWVRLGYMCASVFDIKFFEDLYAHTVVSGCACLRAFLGEHTLVFVCACVCAFCVCVSAILVSALAVVATFEKTIKILKSVPEGSPATPPLVSCCRKARQREICGCHHGGMKMNEDMTNTKHNTHTSMICAFRLLDV